MATSTDATTLVLAPGEGELIEVLGNRIRVLAAAPRVTVIDYTAPPGFPGPPLHVHTAFDELFLVLEGRLEMRVRNDVHDVGPGGSAFVEGGVPHTFANPTAEPVRFLAVCAPGGFEDYLRALAAGDQAGVAAASALAGYAPQPGD